jgi:hypothetical protein
MLLLNSNRFDSLTLLDGSGRVRASTAGDFGDPRHSPAFLAAVADDALVLIERDGLLEFAAPVRDEGGTLQSVLVAWATPSRIFALSLATSVDGSEVTLERSDGSAVEGVATAVGAACASVPVERETGADGPLLVNACLPAGLNAGVSVAHQAALARVAAAVLAITALGLAALAWVLRDRRRRAAAVPVGLAMEARLLAESGADSSR